MAAKMSVRRTLYLSGISHTDQLSFVFGSINGQLRSAFSKLSALHAKNVFSFAIVTGNLFSEAQDDDQLTDLLEGRIDIPCPIYFTVGTIALPPRVVERVEKDEEVAPNLHYLGKRSVTKTSEGVRIVTLGGVLDPNIVAGPSKDQYEPFHTDGDAKALRGANNADILLTAMWPSDVWKNSPKAKELQIGAETAPSSQTMAELCEALKPRYHFATSPGDFAFEREPFFTDAAEENKDASIALTRFLSLAPWANTAKAKSMYAFTLNRDTILTPPAGSTLTPFFNRAAKQQQKRTADQAEFTRFSHPHDNDHHARRRKHHHHNNRRERSPPPGPDRCFFCLSNPNLPTHMVCAVGEDAYLATAKGPLSSSTTFAQQGLAMPGHFIITPLTHAPSLSAAAMVASGEEGEAARTFREMARFRDALQGMVAAASGRKLGGVTWEINRARNIHVHWQFMPVPAEMVSGGLVEAGFRVLAEDLKLGKLVVKDFETADEVPGDYFRVWIWAEEDGEEDGGKVAGKCLLLRFDEGVRFDLQYPRKVMAKLLGLEDRMVWQDVAQTEEEEKKDVATFREAFKEWDFTLA
ncbi:CwfJ C-terminus 2-domain-containing protein-like protein [Staphylotrichum tortipilum]|uniref:CwfJ C-terminus 2-domain-containing protein-like protein n=1 Tax=Staphylotrichum tortipilum TaxID=2831512 RepID=A0AAN6MH82_9PEZI|nr:CwfJ C-terminus 2-domain-containing protein-like protein [Staphylotrichum longicolle]